MAPWISNLIKMFENKDEYNVHIIAPNIFNNKNSSFSIHGIQYHFYRIHLLRLPKKIRTLFKIIFGGNYFLIQRRIKKIVEKINPELINLWGAENPYYSAGIIPLIGKYPIFVTIQGFIRHTFSLNQEIKKRIRIEETIISKCSYFGTRTEEMDSIIRDINPNADLYHHDGFLTIPSVQKSNESQETFDCIFFARVCKDKGIEDLLLAISMAKRTKNDITLHIIGESGDNYLKLLKKMCLSLGIEENVRFIGFVPSQEEIHSYAINGKICVLPTYHDAVPGTIIESMFMKIPIVAYSSGGISYLNDGEERIVLVERLNVEQLAEKMVSLLADSVKRKVLAERAYLYAKATYNNEKALGDLLNAYKHVLK